MGRWAVCEFVLTRGEFCRIIVNCIFEDWGHHALQRGSYSLRQAYKDYIKMGYVDESDDATKFERISQFHEPMTAMVPQHSLDD